MPLDEVTPGEHPDYQRALLEAFRHVKARSLSGLAFHKEARWLAAEMVKANAVPRRTLTKADRAVVAELTRRGPKPFVWRKTFLKPDLVSAFAAARGHWRRGTTRERKPSTPRGSRLVASRDGPRRSADDDPPPLTRFRGFAAASARMIVHLERRRAAIRIARMA
jgi:hypothetical protein